MRIPSLVAAVMVLLVSASAEAQAGLKVGYINSASILEQAPGAQEAQDQFNRDVEGFRTQVQEMADELQVMIENFEKQQLTLSADARTRREEEIRLMQQTYQERVQQLDQQAGERQQELVQPVMDRISQVIEQLRAEGSYSLIFDVSAGSIISADSTLDLTDEVVRRLQAQAATGGSGARR